MTSALMLAYFRNDMGFGGVQRGEVVASGRCKEMDEVVVRAI